MAEFCASCAAKMGFEPELLEPGEICEGCGRASKVKYADKWILLVLIAAIIISLVASSAKAQRFTKSDSSLYGTPEEKRDQDAMATTPYHSHLVRYIGYKVNYMNELGMFYQEMNYSLSSKMVGNTLTLTFVTPGFTPSQIKKVYAAFTVEPKTGRTRALTITGDTYQLIKLFVVYWPTVADFDTPEKMQNRTIAIKHLIDEEITYKLLPTGKAQITITKPAAVN